MHQLKAQRLVCERYKATYLESPLDLKIGISENVKKGARPIHGLRLNPSGDTTGWYIWAGEYSDNNDFFVPLHVKHISDWQPQLSRYLGLGPGWRFLINPEEGYEDVWFDASICSDSNQ